MSKQREALELALEALVNLDGIDTETECVTICVDDEINAILEALAEPEPWTPDDMAYRPGGLSMDDRKPLTDDEISAIVQSMSAYTWDAHMLARAIEKAHGIEQ